MSSVLAAGLPADLVGEVEWCGSLCKNTHVSRLLSSVPAAGLPADEVDDVQCGVATLVVQNLSTYVGLARTV